MRELIFFCFNLFNIVLVTSREYRSGNSYLEDISTFGYNAKEVLNGLPQEDLPVGDFRRHYLIVYGVVHTLAEYLNDCWPSNYEQGYLPIVDQAIPRLWQDHEAVKNITDHIEDILRTLMEIKLYIEDHCKGINKWRCFYGLRNEFPNLDRTREFLDLIRTINNEYSNLRSELTRAVISYNEVRFLINGRKKLRPLVEAIAGVYKMLYGVKCIKRR